MGQGVVAARLLRDVVHLPEEMTVHLDRFTSEASRRLVCEVPRSAVVRAAVAAWLDDADHRPKEIVIEAIRAAAERGAEPLRHYPQRWPEEMAVRLDQLVREARRVLICKISRSMIVRTAIAAWLDGAEHRPPENMSRAILAAMVRRGRKAAD